MQGFKEDHGENAKGGSQMNKCSYCIKTKEVTKYNNKFLCADCLGRLLFDADLFIDQLKEDSGKVRRELAKAVETHDMMLKQFDEQEQELQKYRQREEEEKLKN